MRDMYVCAVNIFNIKTYESFGGKDEDYLGEYSVYLILVTSSRKIVPPSASSK